MTIKPFKMLVTPAQSEKVKKIILKNGYNFFHGTEPRGLFLVFSDSGTDDIKGIMTLGDTNNPHFIDIEILIYERFLKLYDI